MANYKRKKIKLNTGNKDAATRKRQRRFVGVFLLLLIIVASASAVTYFREKAENERAEYAESDITLVDDSDKKESVNILFVPVSADGEVLYLCVFGINTSSRSYTVMCLNTPPNADYQKPLELMQSAEDTYGIKLDRYVVITRDQFKDFMQVLGGYEINLKNRIDYAGSDFTLNLQAGKRTLYGDLFFNYLRYTGLSGSEREREQQAKIIVDYIRQRLTKETVDNGDEIFSRLVNTCTTNINITDFNKYQSVIKASVEKKLKISVIKLENDK